MTTNGYSRMAMVALGVFSLFAPSALGGNESTTRIQAELARAEAELANIESQIAEVQKAAQEANQRYVDAMGEFNATGDIRFRVASREAVRDKTQLAKRHSELVSLKAELEKKINVLVESMAATKSDSPVAK